MANKKKIAFGQHAHWDEAALTTINRKIYNISFHDFWNFDPKSVDYIVPLSLDDAEVMRSRFGGANPKYILPAADAIALCADKDLFNKTILDGDYSWMIPPIYSGSARYRPYVLKKRDTCSGFGSFVIRNAADETMHAAALAGTDYFCQAYVPGRFEYATHMLIVDGRAVYHETNAYEMAGEFSIKGTANQPVDETLGMKMDQAVIDDLEGLMRSIGFEGVCCLDYKLIDGQVRLLEVNPRVGFSLFRDINRFLDAYMTACRRSARQHSIERDVARTPITLHRHDLPG